MENALIRILPACLSDALPAGWEAGAPGFVIEVAPAVARPAEIIPALAQTEPDVLLLDADAELDAFGLTQQALAARPGLAVVIISRDAAPDRLRRAMLAGAEEYLIKPLDAEEMNQAIMAVTAHRTLRRVQRAQALTPLIPDTPAGLVVGVVSGKGGLGKTTLASNLAMLVARTSGRTAALVGLESGDGAILLSLQPKLGLMDLAGSSNGDGSQTASYSDEWLRQFGTSHKSGLQYWTWQGSATQPGASIPEDFFEQLFAALRASFSVTVIDFPALSADEVAHVMPLLDSVIVVSSSSDLLALRSARTFLDMIPAEVNERTHVIINRADESDMISREDFERTLGRKVAGVINNESRLAAEAINMGTPVVLMQPQSEIAVDLAELAQTLFQLPTTDEREPRKKRFRLFG